MQQPPWVRLGLLTSKQTLITFLLEPELLERLDDYRFGMRMASRGAAIRYLLEAALDMNPFPEPNPREDDQPSTARRGPGKGPILPRANE